jgi:type I restriction enzyme S subunit
MKGQFFMNTGIQPSVIFFEKTGRPTTAVEFWEATKTDKGEIVDVLVQTVPREKFDASCSMDLRRYQENAGSVANPAGYPMMKLRDICKVSFGERITQKEHAGSLYPVYGSGGETFKTDNFNRVGKTCKVGRFALSEGSMVMLVNGPYWLMDSGFTVESKNTDIILTEFLWYSLLMDKKQLSSLSTGSCQKNIDMDAFYSVEYPCPSIAIQEEIVATLDRIYQPGTTELADTLKMTDKAMDLVLANPTGATLEPLVDAQRLIRKSAQMVADVKAQMVADVKAQMVAIINASMATAVCKKYILSDLAIDNPENIAKTDNYNIINYIDLGSVKEGNITSIQAISMAEKPSRAQRKIKDGDILWGCVRPLSRSYAFVESAVENMIGSSGFVVLRNKDATKVLSKYLYYALTTDDCVNYLNNRSAGTSYPAFNSATIMAYSLMVPPIDIQSKTLTRLDALQSQLTALESLQKQSEDNARFILESYLSSPSSSPSSETAEE